MLGKLSAMANLMGAQKMIQQVSPILREHLQKMSTYKAQQIQDDAFFDETISTPAWQAIRAKLGGIIQLYPGLETKFFSVMRKLRSELLEVKADGEVTLVADYETRLPQVALAAIQESL